MKGVTSDTDTSPDAIPLPILFYFFGIVFEVNSIFFSVPFEFSGVKEEITMVASVPSSFYTRI